MSTNGVYLHGVFLSCPLCFYHLKHSLDILEGSRHLRPTMRYGQSGWTARQEAKYARERVFCRNDAQYARERALHLKVRRLEEKNQQQVEKIESLELSNKRLQALNDSLQRNNQPNTVATNPVAHVSKSFMQGTAASKAKERSSTSTLHQDRGSSASPLRDDHGRLRGPSYTAGYAKLTRSYINKMPEDHIFNSSELGGRNYLEEGWEDAPKMPEPLGSALPEDER